jgi:outer membrane protein insertion porin family
MKGIAALARIVPAILLLTLATAWGNARGEGFRVIAIDVQGTRRASPDAVRQVMSTRVGEELDLAKIRQDVKAISAMGYFRDVAIDSEEAPGGVRLTVILTEKPIVGAVSIEGNKDVDQDALREALTVKERSLLQEDKIKESAAKLREVCQNQGYYDATVESVVTEEKDGSIRVTFRVTEGEKLKIERIEVSGNLFFTRKQILKVMDTNEKGLFSFITQSGVVKRDVLENDIRKVEALYQNNGFLDSKVFDPTFGMGRNGLVLSVRVFEGRQYRVGEVRFSGESGVPEAAMRGAVKLKGGDLYNREVLVGDLLALTTLVNDQGYAQALVSPGVEKRKDYPVADVTYRIDRGEKFRFGKVEVSGNTKTYDRVIRRRLEVADGLTYSATKLKESKENLTRTSYFKDVKVTTAPSERKGEMDVKVEIQEAPTGTFSGGMGFSTMDGLFGVVQLSENNLFGRGWRSTLSSQFGSRRTSYTLDFSAPNFMDSDYSLLLNVYRSKIEYTQFEKQSSGGKIGTGVNLSRFVHASVLFGVDDTRIMAKDDVRPSEVIRDEIDKGTQTTRSIFFNISRNTTNRFIDPSKGTVHTASLQYAGGPFGGDSQFVKYILNAKRYFPVSEHTVFSTNLAWGHAISTDGGWNRGEVPLYERFFLGGPYSVRGFKARSISPVDRKTGDDIGGNKYLIANAEYQIPLAPEAGFKGVFFVDAGNTWDQGKWPFKSQGLWVGYGIGVRWYSPMGPMRFEYGWNLDRPPGDPAGVFEFTIGTAF